ncbi:hypothetical protein [Lutimonas zeaxanthinifaciens]|uniref:hypothetical protein n=1 Tax=Lutimonas zeaxanthinifaciens TaxID=3060215 RepID=UPI00265D4A8F|nr:hypothetical protein [Lutimonas sp. YSD2104]WKK65373.1 hypothetical protein QZH61_12385 [Lutimonas sp. YSD2104]
MNSKLLFVLAFFITFSSIDHALAQEDENEPSSSYVTVTTLHGVDGFDFDAWKEVEEEYFEKVTSKIDLIRSHEVLMSFFAPQFGEIKVINVIDSWEDIMTINEMREALVQEAWPDEEERKAFFEKQNSFYQSKHSDEIFLTSEFSKDLIREAGQNRPYVFMIRNNILSDTEDEDSYENYKKYFEEVVLKNNKVQGYYPFSHFWGDDSREFVEIFVFDTFSDVEDSQYESNALLSKIVPEEEDRRNFLSSLFSAIESQETLFYRNIPSLSK